MSKPITDRIRRLESMAPRESNRKFADVSFEDLIRARDLFRRAIDNSWEQEEIDAQLKRVAPTAWAATRKARRRP
jgi:hypothetical protein